MFVRVSVCLNHRLKETIKRWRERRESVLCWQADGLSCCLPRSSTSHPITPASSHQLVIHWALTSTLWSLSPRAPSHPSVLVCFVGCMSSVRCNLSWLICCGVCVGVKPAKRCPLLTVSGAVCIGKAPACWEASRPSAVSKDLLGWNPPSKDTWQPFTATRDRTSTDPTVVPPLLVSRRLFVTGHSWVSVSFMFLQAESVMSEWHFYAWLVVWNVRKITLIPQYFI